MDPDKGRWFQERVQELVRSLQEGGKAWAPPRRPSLAGRLRQFAQPRLRRFFGTTPRPELRAEDTEAPIAPLCGDSDMSRPQCSNGDVPSIVLEDVEGDSSAMAPAAVTDRSQLPRLQLQLQPQDDSVLRKSPVTVQEWVDSLPAPESRPEDDVDVHSVEDGEEALDLGLGAEAGLLYNGCSPTTVISPPQHQPIQLNLEHKLGHRGENLVREPSIQSDVTSHGSHGSSVESFLESRKPDPEEVLLSLGFGGSTSVDSEVSRIPRRFLQPSKVKGVAIDDFLKYQQDLIETFETGFCGYRGLTGPSHTVPSVIVAKIMETLREKSPSLMEEGGSSSCPEQRRLSRATRRSARHVQSASTETLSVLSPDNRRFLESQGRNKSPEVPRKRIIFGTRSFTFAGDGDLVEVENSLPQDKRYMVPKPKPLVHKDSVLSSATSVSMTSVDSDSDTDEGSYEMQLRRKIRPTYLTPNSSTETAYRSGGTSVETDTEPIRPRPMIGKRLSSTSVSSWESETTERRLRFFPSSSSVSLESCPRHVRYESIDENVEIDYVIGESSTEATPCQSKENSTEIEKCVEVSDRPGSLVDRNEEAEINECVLHGEGNTESKGEVGSLEGTSCLQNPILLRRSSLKRQNHVTEDDVVAVVDDQFVSCDSAVISKLKEEHMSKSDPTTENISDMLYMEEVCLADLCIEKDALQNLNSKCNVNYEKCEEPAEITETLESDKGSRNENICSAPLQEKSTILSERNALVVINDVKGDSFEMEEIGVGDDDNSSCMLLRARSDSSGFLEDERFTLQSSGKRLSLPVPDETIISTALPSRSSSLHSLSSGMQGRSGSLGNMFSSCSDESVIHVPSRDLQDLLDELAGRGLQVPDTSIACQLVPLKQTEAVRLALGAYGQQLNCGMKSNRMTNYPADFGQEVRMATEVREQVVSELRRVAALLEERPEPQLAAAITRQMTALLRDQTKLCQQLEALAKSQDQPLPHLDKSPCCDSERLLNIVRDENRHLQRLVEAHSAELVEIRQLLAILLSNKPIN